MAKTCYFPFLFLTYFFLSSALLARSDDGYVYSESASKYVRPNSNDEQQQDQQNLQPGKAQDGVAATMNNDLLSSPQSFLSVEEAEEGEGGSQSRLKRATPPAAETATEAGAKTATEAGAKTATEAGAKTATEAGAKTATEVAAEAAPEEYKTRDNKSVVALKGSMVQTSENSEALNEKIRTITTIFSLHPSRYIGTMKELFHLYNKNIDITKYGFSYGSISLHMQFSKHTTSEDIATLNTVFYAHHRKNESLRNVEMAKGEHVINLNVDELLSENERSSVHQVPSIEQSGGNVTPYSSVTVYQAIKDSQLDATKLFITLDKVGESKFSVSKLDDFLGDCLKAAQDDLAKQNDADKKKKKKAGNLQNADEVSGGQASGSQASSGERNDQKGKKNRKVLMNEFKQSLVAKDMEACKQSAKLLMANSTVSSLMYLFVLVALGVFLL